MNNTLAPDLNGETPQTEPHSPSFPLVGLGASAGGITALQTFFDGMPADSGMAFVVIMHLAPNHESSLAHILQSRTAMPVVQVVERVEVAPNHVYVIPPNKHLAVADGHIHLAEPQQPAGRRLAIDLFFRTLAAHYGPRALAIVLSGADSDGVIGIKHVKEQGGITLVQDPNEAEFDSMPRGAIATGMVDWVLPVAQMPPQLTRFMRNEQLIHVPPDVPPEETALSPGAPQGETDTPREDKNSGGPLTIHTVPSITDEDALLEALRFVRTQTGHDFSHYKRATLLRRVARRMQVNLLEDIPSYLAFLRAHPIEATALLQDLLISVTNFFRDRDAFEALESHVPQIFAGKPASDQVRVWVCGCATGEEAYSVAMLLLSHISRLDAPPSIQVFATDLDEAAIATARQGLYPSTIEADVSQERLRRFFQKEHGSYRIRKEVREVVLFSQHNVLKDSPFSRLDVVTCRNLLIYLKREAQEGVFDLFHFALRAGGLLFLGSSETLDQNHALFAPLDKTNRLFVRRNVPRNGWQFPVLALAPPSPVTVPLIARGLASILAPEPFEPAASAPSAPLVAERGGRLFGNLHLRMLERYAPPSLVVDANYNIAHLSEHAGRFLQLAGGEMSTNLLKMAHPALRLELRAALFRAAKDAADVSVMNVPFEEAGVTQLINLHVRPAQTDAAAEGFLLVVFEPVDAGKAAPPVSAPDAEAEDLTRHLEAENQHLRTQLGSLVEQYEGSLEELKAANEELQAVNEEMRSATEELETSKEELQAINEELTTVNQELKSNVEELSRSNSDLQNLMASTQIATVFLDRQMAIKRFTPGAQELFNLIATDVGRPLSDITHKLEHPSLIEDAEGVLRDLRISEREVSSGGRWYLGRILPYRTAADHIDGVVLTFVDITARKEAEEALRQSEERLRFTIENVTDYAIFNLDAEGRVATWNEGCRRLLGYESAEILGLHFRAFYTEAERQAGIPDQGLETARATGRYEDEGWRIRKNGSRFWSDEILNVVQDASGGRTGFVKVARNLSQRRIAAEERRALEHETTLLTERNRMAQELHDTLAQGFTGIKLQLDVAQLALEATPTETAEGLQHIQRAREIAQQSQAGARHSIRALRSPMLEQSTLPEALQQLAGEVTDGPQVVFRVEGTPVPLSALVENDVYRIGQEALTNALRHSQAQQIIVTLTYFADELHLTVTDDGRGFDPQSVRTGFGVTGMQERAQRHGTQLQIVSQPGQGTQITLVLMLNRLGRDSQAATTVQTTPKD